MAINKNDCMDCGNLQPVIDKQWNTVGWICLATGEVKCLTLKELDILDEDCPNFKYQE